MSALHALLPAAVKEYDLDHVRVIALTDDTKVETLAREAELKDVTDGPSRRRLHGRLMKQLANSKCASVVWDIGFPATSDFDKDFVDGVLTLRHVGIPVVVTVEDWWLGEGDKPVLAEEILAKVRIGCSCAFLEQLPWAVMLVAQRGMADPLPSLSLAGFAAARYPRSEVTLRYDRPTKSLDLLYWTFEGQNPNVKKYQGQDHIELTDARDRTDITAFSPPVFPGRPDLLDTDAQGVFYVAVPSDEKLEAATIPYETAFRADHEELQRRFAGKVVIVGDLREDIDRHPHPDGRKVPGCHVHAAAIEGLFRRTFIQSVRRGEEVASAWIGALLGCAAGVTAAGSALRRYLALAGLAIAGIAACFCASWWFKYLLNPPLIPLAALWMSCEASAAVLRIWQARREES